MSVDEGLLFRFAIGMILGGLLYIFGMSAVSGSMIFGLWGWAILAGVVGMIPGLLFFPWIASPVGPGLWILSAPIARVFLTISQYIRGAGVLVKRASGEYEIGTYLPERELVQLTDRKLAVDGKQTRWGLFGKKRFGITWEPGTDLHERIKRDDTPTDGGGWPVNMGAAHRFLEGTNDADAITRTEEKAKAKYGGGDKTLSDLTMVALIVMMLLLGSLTSYMML